MDLDLPFTPAVKRLITVCALLALALTGFADVALLSMAPDPWHPATNWLPVLVTGPLLILAVGDTRFSPPLLPRIWMVVAMSLTLSGICVAVPQTGSSVGALEIAGLLGLLLRTAARTARPKAAAASAAALSVTVLVLPFRTGSWPSIVAGVYMLTVILAIVITLGCAIRAMEARRRRAITDVRQAERLALARDLHDLIAHHMTGIIVQAHAATAVYPTAPDKVEPILRNIAQAGTETLESMRRLVRVLREDNHTAVRPGDLLSELAELTASYSTPAAMRPRARHCAPRSHRGRAHRPHQPRSGDLRLPRGPGSTHQCAQARPRRPGRHPPRRRQHLAAARHHRHRRTPPHRCTGRRPGRLRPHRPARTGRSARRNPSHRPSAQRRVGSESHLPTACPVRGSGPCRAHRLPARSLTGQLIRPSRTAPCSHAHAAISTRLRASTLAWIRPRYVLTVDNDRNSSSQISWLVRPTAISRTMSNSRTLSPNASTPAGCRTRLGLLQPLQQPHRHRRGHQRIPRAAARTASTSKAGVASFSRNPHAPLRRAVRT